MPLREQTCHVSKFDSFQLDNLSKDFSYDLFFAFKEGRQIFFDDQGKKRWCEQKLITMNVASSKWIFLQSFEMYHLNVS